ncbi:MAG: DNA mismatch repair endonuclease MutL, partial [Firmicutes bacterium]|nr:DNA mismatch repair endonuclease MutL [Bacillota bacterium]
MTPHIHVLDPFVANQIAAGEVVERPASVVKELLENSIDAGAQRIRIEIEHGGLQRISVQDDGTGIAVEDLPLALAPHATSKLTVLEDLDLGHTLGFRGEALASISAVAKVSLASRLSDQPVGYRLDKDHRRQEAIVPVPMPPGTRIDVAELFASVPARLKAMKSPAAEWAAIQTVVQQFAIGYPDIAVHLVHDGRSVLNTS